MQFTNNEFTKDALVMVAKQGGISLGDYARKKVSDILAVLNLPANNAKATAAYKALVADGTLGEATDEEAAEQDADEVTAVIDDVLPAVPAPVVTRVSRPAWSHAVATPVSKAVSKAVAPDASAALDALRGLLGAGLSRAEIETIVIDLAQRQVDRAKDVFAAQIDTLGAASGKYAQEIGSMIVEHNKAIDAKIAQVRTPTVVKLEIPALNVKKDLGIQHRSFTKLLKTCNARDHQGNRLNALLVGPAGSGKTTAADHVAKALNLPFYFNGAIDTEYKLKGFMDAQGRLISPAFRKAYENGGVYLFDEIDASMQSAVLAFNSALANGWCDFPDGMVQRHPDCIVIAGGNTWMGGGTFDYVGRVKQDAAFADRFAMLYWEIDEDLEMATGPNPQWTTYVQKIRSRVIERGIKGAIVSPRASYIGAALLAADLDRDDVIKMTVRKGMSDEQWKQVAA